MQRITNTAGHIHGTLASYDPYRLDQAIQDEPAAFLGATIKVSCARLPSIGALSPNHTLLTRDLSPFFIERRQELFDPSSQVNLAGVEMRGIGGELKSSATNALNTPGNMRARAEDMFASVGHEVLHGVPLDINKLHPRTFHLAATAIALGTQSDLWQAVAKHHSPLFVGESFPTYVARFRGDGDEDKSPPRAVRAGRFVGGLRATGDAIEHSHVGATDLPAEMIKGFETRFPLLPREARSAAQAIDKAYRKLSPAQLHVTNRGDHLVRLVLGMYDFYSIRHDEDHPYLVEPSVAQKHGFNPPPTLAPSRRGASLDAAATRVTLPNPLFVIDYCPKELGGSDSTRQALPWACAEFISPTYQHPSESTDYGRVEGYDIPAYMATNAIHDSWERAMPLAENGHVAVDYSNPEAHLHHVAWAPAHAGAHFIPGLLPADQLRFCCTLSLHSNDSGTIEAARAMNPEALVAVARFAGVSVEIIDRFIVLAKALRSERSDLTGSLTTSEQAVLAAIASPEASPEDFAAFDRIQAEATQRLLTETVRKHATNILARHPALMHPAAVMPIVNTLKSVRFKLSRSAFTGTEEVWLEYRAPLTSLPLNLALGNISLPTGADAPAFANHPCVRLGLGDRKPNMIRRSRKEGIPQAVDATGSGTSAGSINGLPLLDEPTTPAAITTPDATGPHQESVIAHIGACRNQVAMALDWIGPAYAPCDFLASVLELNTHTNEFIRYQHELNEYLHDFDPKTGLSGASPPTVSPFQVLGFTMMNDDLFNHGNSISTPESLMHDYERFIGGEISSTAPTSWHSALGEAITNTVRMLPAELVQAFKSDAGRDLGARSLSSLAPLQASSLTPLDPGIIQQRLRDIGKVSLQDASGAMNLGARDQAPGSAELRRQRDAQQVSAFAAATLRLLRAARAHVMTGAVTANFITHTAAQIQRTPNTNAGTKDMETLVGTAVGVSHFLGLHKTKMGAIRSLYAHCFSNPFLYRHDLDGLALDAGRENPRIAAALDRAFDAGLAQVAHFGANQDALLEMTADPAFAHEYTRLDGTNLISGPGRKQTLLARACANPKPLSEPNTLAFPLLPIADSLPACPSLPHPVAAAVNFHGDVRSQKAVLPSGSLASVAAVNNMVQHGVGPLFFGASRTAIDRCATLRDINYATAASTYQDILENGIEPMGDHYCTFEGLFLALSALAQANDKDLDVLRARGDSYAPPPNDGHSLLMMVDEAAICAAPKVDDLQTCASTISTFAALGLAEGPGKQVRRGGLDRGAAPGGAPLGMSIVRIGDYGDNYQGTVSDTLKAERLNLRMRQSMEATASPPPTPRATKPRRV